MNKKLMIPMFAILFLGSVFAVGYVVNSFVIQSDVYEPLQVSYAVVGDADNWDGVSCVDYTGGYTPIVNSEVPIDMDGLYAGEGRALCFTVTNLGQADVPFTISNEITNPNEVVNAKCVAAFGEHSLSDTAVALTDTVTGVGVVVNTNAEPVNDCLVKIEVARV